jgi:fucose permease
MIANALLSAAIPASDIFLYLGIWCFVSFAPFLILLKKLPHKNAEAMPAGSALGMGALLKNGRFLLLCLIMFLYVGMSASVATWMPSYMTGTLRVSKLYSGLPISLYWVGAIIGRVTFSFINEKRWIKPLQLSTVLISGLLFIPAVLLHNPLFVAVGCGLMGLSSSMLAPFALSTGGMYFPSRTGAASSLLIMSCTAGQMVIPYVNGLLIDAAGFTVGMLFPAAVCLLQCVPLALVPKPKAITVNNE